MRQRKMAWLKSLEVRSIFDSLIYRTRYPNKLDRIMTVMTTQIMNSAVSNS